MENITTAISVQVDSKDKELASSILKNLGLNMSTFVNMAIKQLIFENGVPFEVKNPKPSKETRRALKEAQEIIDGKVKSKGYYDVHQMFEDIVNED